MASKKRKKKKNTKRNTKKIMFKNEECSPENMNNSLSCLNNNLIKKIAKILNKINSSNKIDLNDSIENIYNNVCDSISSISSCSSESCWMKISKLMDNLNKSDQMEFKNSFKPIMPSKWIKDYNTWLSTRDIEQCLNQHLKKDNNFYFYGAVPIDFNNCSVSNLCSINIKEHLNNNKSKIGVVFNTDPSTESGEHWISMYIDLLGHNSNFPGIYYFDSFGKEPKDEITELVEKIKSQCNDNNIKIYYLYNDFKHQKQNSQCGIYSIYFIKKMLEGMPFKKFLKSGLSDKKMKDLRKEFFVRL